MPDAGTIVGLIVAILMVIGHIIKGVRESTATRTRQDDMQSPPTEYDDLLILTTPKAGRQSKPGKQRASVRQPMKNVRSVLEDTSIGASKKQSRSERTFSDLALTKKLSPQGEGQRFEADPGTLDTTHIVTPSFDPSVKPELESITGIYENEATSIEGQSVSAITLNIADWLTKPETICHAIILAEILNRPAWDFIHWDSAHNEPLRRTI